MYRPVLRKVYHEGQILPNLERRAENWSFRFRTHAQRKKEIATTITPYAAGVMC